MQNLLTDSELDIVEPNLEKEECVRSLSRHLNTIGNDSMQYVLNNPRFQLTWRKTCRLFGFYAGDKGKCSASNIEAFRIMIAKEYPDIYKELSDTGVKAIENIQIKALAKSRDILKR